jgi:hypothetical protein
VATRLASWEAIRSYDHGEFFFWDGAMPWGDPNSDGPLPAIEAAQEAGHDVAFVEGCGVVFGPRSFESDALVVVETWDATPALELDAEASSLAELDLDLEGGLVVTAPEGVPVTVQVPPGSYRLRVAGHGFGEGEPTSWAFRLWPRVADGPPVVHRVGRPPR